VRKLYALLAQCHRRLGQPAEALSACQAGRVCYPDDAELLFGEALARRDQRDLAGAEACLLRLIGGGEGEHFASVTPGLRGHKARHNLAVIYREQGRLPEAEAQWRAALAEAPGFVAAWAGLGEVLLAQGRIAEVDEAIAALEAAPETAMEAAVLKARGQMAQREFAAARRLLEEAIARSPQAVRLREVLSHCLLQEGRDWGAAERALREVLALDPGNAEAANNLALLLRQQGRADEGPAPSGPATAAQGVTTDEGVSMRVSVVIPSRLQALPGGAPGELYLHRAVASVCRQTAARAAELEVVVGLDPEVRPPPLVGVVLTHGERARQACALNAAVAACRGQVIAFLEDDDLRHPKRLEYGLGCLAEFDLVTCNQLEVDPQGRPLGVNDYPTPSGWLLPRTTWERVGPFDETFTFVDSELLGRVNAGRLRRVHLVEAGATFRPGLINVARYSAVRQTTERPPLVVRAVNAGGVVASLGQGEAARRRHEEDCRRMVAKYGLIPW
jgi:Tfp pilus assembly protein PilF